MGKQNIPKQIREVIDKFKENGYQAYAVGGCVRDFLTGKDPADWDMTTNANPQQIEKLFKKTYLDNKYGTVRILTESKEESLKELEVTPFRIESKYSDKRHPDQIKWGKTLEEDLKRRDFTVNAMAMDIEDGKYEIIDLFEGKKDLENKLIKAVGKAEDRFNEDALRMIRAVRFAVKLGKNWKIEENTEKAIIKNSSLLKLISGERIRDELKKIILSPNAAGGIELLRKLGLLKYIIGELEEGYQVGQNKHHIYDCYQHNLRSLEYAAKKDFNFNVRMAALLHDVGKPRTKRGEGENATFYNHEIVGAKMTEKILKRLKFSNKEIKKITTLVRYHLFYYNVGEVGESSIRRLVRNAGIENMEELLQVRQSDRIGSGCPKAEPYKLRHLKYMIEKVMQDPISVKELKIKGDDIMKILSMEPGPKIGQILDILLGFVLQDPKKNNIEFLENKTKELFQLKESELLDLSALAREEREKIETKKDEMRKEKYWVS